MGFVKAAADQAREEYIESELARRKRLAAEHRAQQEGGDINSSSNAMTNSMTNLLAADPTLSVGGGKVESQRALHGKLMEIDLGEEARARNIAETERARRRLEGQIMEEEEDADGRRKKVRLGPDGKPWRSRNRRDSDALKRDQQVEEFLRENRCKFYVLPIVNQRHASDANRWCVLLQWTFTTCPPTSPNMPLTWTTMRWPPTTASLKSSGVTLWTPCRRDIGVEDRLSTPPLGLRPGTRTPKSSRVQNWVAVAMPERLCARSCSGNKSSRRGVDNSLFVRVVPRILSTNLENEEDAY